MANEKILWGSIILVIQAKLGVMVCVCTLSTQETAVGGWKGEGQPWPYSKTTPPPKIITKPAIS